MGFCVLKGQNMYGFFSSFTPPAKWAKIRARYPRFTLEVPAYKYTMYIQKEVKI